MANPIHVTVEKAFRVAGNGPALLHEFNQHSDCYHKESKDSGSTWKLTPQEVQNFRNDVLPHLPAEKIDKLINDVFAKLTEGTRTGENSDAYVS